MKRDFPHLVTAILLSIAILAAACAKEPVVFGAAGDAEFGRVPLYDVRRNLVQWTDRPVFLTGKFQYPLPPGFVEEFDAFQATTDFGEFVVLSPAGKYTATVNEMKEGRPIEVYGRVWSFTPPGKRQPVVAIKVG
ncbi:hypothetical protein K8I61_15670 [bacterium]|nr:hypothetical protein [bacterium]